MLAGGQVWASEYRGHLAIRWDGGGRNDLGIVIQMC